MKKAIVFVVLCLTLIGTWTWFCIDLTIKVNAQEETVKSNLGKRILFEKDSVTIIDYETFNEVYVLSNGKKINFKLVK